MKRTLFLTTFAFLSLTSVAQDMIVKKDGSIIQAKVAKIGTSEVEYKKWSNQDGPLYAIAKSDILAINYQNGEKEMFENSQTTSAKDNINSDPSFIEVPVSPENTNIISLYNKRYSIGDKYSPSNSKASSAITIYGVSETSTMSNADIQIKITTSGHPFYHHLVIKNKTNKILYIDKGNCFRVSINGNYCYYKDGSVTSITNGSGSGVSLGLGSVTSALGIGGIIGTLSSGLSVAKGNMQSTTSTVGSQRFMVLPPFGETEMDKDDLEDFLYGSDFVNVHKGEVLNYNSTNSPDKIDYIISYSDNQNFATYTCINFQLYMKQVFGTSINRLSQGINDTPEKVIKRRVKDYDSNCILGFLGKLPMFSN